MALTCGEVEYEHKEQGKEFKEMFIRDCDVRPGQTTQHLRWRLPLNP